LELIKKDHELFTLIEGEGEEKRSRAQSEKKKEETYVDSKLVFRDINHFSFSFPFATSENKCYISKFYASSCVLYLYALWQLIIFLSNMFFFFLGVDVVVVV